MTAAEPHVPAPATGGPLAAAPAAPAVGAAPGNVSHALEEINDETRSFLGSKPQVRDALERSPLAAEALKACQSLCYPRFVTEAQITRLEEALERAKQMNIAVNTREVQRALKAAQDPAALDAVIGQIEQGVSVKIQVGEDIEAASQVAGEAKALEAGPVAESPYLTDALRRAPGRVRGGLGLATRTRLLEPGIGTGPFPGQIAARMRAIGDFKNWADFRQTFWKLVAEDPGLNQGWRPANLKRMLNGEAPFAGKIAGKVQATGGGANARLQLNHIRALKNAGEVFDLDNIEIVTGVFHAAIGD